MGSEKYKKVIDALRKSGPELDSSAEIEQNVLNILMKRKQTPAPLLHFFEMLFGWVYIGWVRRSLIGASFLLVGLFIGQQNNIQRQLDYLRRDVSRITAYDPTDALEKKMIVYKLSVSHQDKPGAVIIPEDQLNQLLDSINDLKIKYRDIMDIINDDPRLRKIIQKKTSRNIRTKIKL
jgi:hypothetical protein